MTDAGADSGSPLIGKDRELAVLERALDELRGCVAIEGEPGIGKTRLLTHLRERAAARGLRVLHGVATDFDRDVPFAAVADAFGEHAQAVTAASPLPDDRHVAHRSARELLESLAPVVVVLDDMHWADAATVELIGALLRRPPAGAVLCALAFRPGHRLDGALADGRARRLALQPLADADAATLLGTTPEDPRVRAAGGNPFYLEQLARLDGSGVPPTVAAALAGELAALPSEARALAEGAAVAGDHFDPDHAAAIAELQDFLAPLDVLAERGVVRAGDQPRRFRFRHPLVQQAVYESTPAGWRIAAHARAEHHLAARGEPASVRAHHVEHAAAPGDDRAVTVLLEAARETGAAAPAAAIRWYTAADRLLARADARRGRVLRELAEAQRAAGELAASVTTLDELLGLTTDPDTRVELTALAAAAEHWQGLHEDASRRLARAWAALADRTSPASVTLRIERAAVELLDPATRERALELAREALAGAGPALAPAALAVVGLAETLLLQLPEARAHVDEAAAAVDALADAELVGRLELLHRLAWAENYLERFDAAIAHSERGVQLARSHGEGRVYVPLLLVAVHPLQMRGELAVAAERAESAVASARGAGNPFHLHWALWELAHARHLLGDDETALALGEESEAVGRGLGPSQPGWAEPGWTVAVTLGRLGQAARGVEVARDALGSWALVRLEPAERFHGWHRLAELHVLAGNRDEACEAAERATAALDGVDLGWAASSTWLARANALLANDRPLDAAAAAGEAANVARGHGLVLTEALAEAQRGEALTTAAVAAHRRGGGASPPHDAAPLREEAVTVLRAAEARLSELGAVYDRDAARRALRRLGVRLDARPAGDASRPPEARLEDLSAREQEIAGLVAERLTNRQIAERLFVSEKTVESHLRNIFAKLRVASRGEVARALERARPAA